MKTATKWKEYSVRFTEEDIVKAGNVLARKGYTEREGLLSGLRRALGSVTGKDVSLVDCIWLYRQLREITGNPTWGLE